MRRLPILFFIITLLISCSAPHGLAPVEDAWYQRNGPIHQVRQGETLYSIAFRYQMDYRKLADLNKLNTPYAINVGDQLILREKDVKVIYLKSIAQQPKIIYNNFFKRNKKSKIKKMTQVSDAHQGKQHRLAEDHGRSLGVVHHWKWPTHGKIIHKFSPVKRNKGIDIAGHVGIPIRAVANGQVAYSGRGIRGYGNLLIIKHNDEFLSAYAYNRKLLVKEGMQVKAGQKIAEMGKGGTQLAMLHFEIRKAGKPVNPLHYLGH